MGPLINLFIITLFITTSIGFLLVESNVIGQSVVAQTIATQAVDTRSDFELGQYYFNHDDDPAPPYDLEKARKHYTAAILEDPRGHVLAWYQLGRIDFLEGKFGNAIYKFNKQIEYFGEGGVPSVHYMLGLTYAYRAGITEDEADWQKAAEGFTNYLQYSPDSPWARIDLAWVYFGQGEYDEMYELLDADYGRFKNNAWYSNMYGLALLNTNQREEAHRVFREAEVQSLMLTEADWGRSYPGNDPRSWGQGLQEMREAIAKNVVISAPGDVSEAN